MKIALIQMDTAWCDPQKNLGKIDSFLKSSREKGARLVVFPETSLAGFCMEADRAAVPLDGDIVRRLLKLTRGSDQLVAIGAAIRRGKHFTNECLLLRDGELVASYAKINLFAPTGEEREFTPGDSLLRLEFDGVRFTPLICFDTRFPRLALDAVATGTDAFLIIANWPSERSRHWKALLTARAIDTMSFVIGVNRVGAGGGLEFCGESNVIGPSGKPLAEWTQTEGEIVLEVDFGLARALRERFPVLFDQYRHPRGVPIRSFPD
jgi:omega-amidase